MEVRIKVAKSCCLENIIIIIVVMSKLYKLMYNKCLESTKDMRCGELIVLELPISSLDLTYTIVGCFEYIKSIISQSYIVKLYAPNYIVIKRTVKEKPISVIRPNSEPIIVGSTRLKKSQVTSLVKRNTKKLKEKYPNIDNIEYYRV